MSVATAVSATLISHPPCRCCSMAIFLGGGGGALVLEKKKYSDFVYPKILWMSANIGKALQYNHVFRCS